MLKYFLLHIVVFFSNIGALPTHKKTDLKGFILAEIKPFSALIYNQDIIDTQDIVTPAYDLISDAEQSRYYQLSPYNVIRLILGKSRPDDNDSHNKYSRAADYLKEWQAEGVLKKYPRPAIYLYRFDYKVNNYSKSVLGFIALVKLVAFDSGKVLPHEKTFAGPKKDRLKLMKSTSANLEQIFSIFSDETGTIHSLLTKVAEKTPLVSVKDNNNVVHTIWPIDDSSVIDEVSKVLNDKTLFIADGHHRYETALNYADWRRSQEKNSPPQMEDYDYIPMLLIDIANEKPELLPTHRVLKSLNGLSNDKFINKLKRFFRVDSCADLAEVSRKLNQQAKPGTFGLYLKKSFYLLTIDNFATINNYFPHDSSDAWKSLDASIWQVLVESEVLGLKHESRDELSSLRFSEDKNEAVNLVDDEKAMAAFLLNPTKISQVKTVAENNEKMPQKSTYFYPKPMTGLILNLMDK